MWLVTVPLVVAAVLGGVLVLRYRDEIRRLFTIRERKPK
jgi:hypothetical protein